MVEEEEMEDQLDDVDQIDEDGGEIEDEIVPVVDTEPRIISTNDLLNG